MCNLAVGRCSGGSASGGVRLAQLTNPARPMSTQPHAQQAQRTRSWMWVRLDWHSSITRTDSRLRGEAGGAGSSRVLLHERTAMMCSRAAWSRAICRSPNSKHGHAWREGQAPNAPSVLIHARAANLLEQLQPLLVLWPRHWRWAGQGRLRPRHASQQLAKCRPQYLQVIRSSQQPLARQLTQGG